MALSSAAKSVINEARAPKGTRNGGQWVKGGGGASAAKKAKPGLKLTANMKVSDKAARALASHKPSTQAKQQLADHGEKLVNKMLDGERTADNLPVDTTTKTKAGKTAGVEVKTVMDNKNGKITMHPESLARKKTWARVNKAKLFTVVVDLRGKSPVFLFAAGVGSFRLHTLTVVRDSVHLKELIG